MKKFKLKVKKVDNTTIEHCECPAAICDSTFIKNLKGLSSYSGVRLHKKPIIGAKGGCLLTACNRFEEENDSRKKTSTNRKAVE